MEVILALVVCIIIIGIVSMFQTESTETKQGEEENRINNNPITIKSKEVYHYATSKNDYIKKLYNEIVKEVLVNNYSPYEAKGITEELKERENEKVETIIGENEEQLKVSIEELLTKKIRPEMIEKACKNYLLQNNKFDEKIKNVFSNKLNNCVRDFDKAYEEIINDKREAQKSSYERYTNDYNNSDGPTGLGFGIITNQVSSALIYQAMEKNSIEKQLRNQRISYENNVASSTGEHVVNNLGRIKYIYMEFGDKLMKSVNCLFNFEKYEKIQEITNYNNSNYNRTENEIISDIILTELEYIDSPITITELFWHSEALSDYITYDGKSLSNQKLSVLLKGLEEKNMVIRTTDGTRVLYHRCNTKYLNDSKAKDEKIITDIILKELEYIDSPITITELFRHSKALSDYITYDGKSLSNQKLSVLLKRLEEKNIVVRTTEGNQVRYHRCNANQK